MSYRNKIAEIADYFRAVHAVHTAIFTIVMSKIMSETIQALIEYVVSIPKKFPEREIYFRPETQINILNIRSKTQHIGNSSVEIYSIEPYVINPRRLYAYYYDRRFLYIYDPSKETVKREKSSDLFTPAPKVWSPSRIPLEYLAEVETPMSIALNYSNLKAVLRPEHFKVIEQLWKIYFGDIR